MQRYEVYVYNESDEMWCCQGSRYTLSKAIKRVHKLELSGYSAKYQPAG